MLEDVRLDRFCLLPIDLLIDSIIGWLPIKDLLALSYTCRSLYSTIHHTEIIWRRRVASEYRFPSEATGRVSGFKTLYRKLSKPQLWVWGQNRDSRLGLGPRKEKLELLDYLIQGFEEVPTPLRLQKAESIKMVDLQAGGWSFHGLDVCGRIWCWGTLDGISRGWTLAPHRECFTKTFEEPARFMIKNLPLFRAISCGRSHVIGISDEGSIYEWHSWSRVAKLLATPWDAPGQATSQKVIQVCAGWDFSAVLLKNGSIYFWREPQALEVSAALDSLPADSRSSTVYELDSADRIIPTPDLHAQSDNESQDENRPIRIACGDDFLICLTASGKVYKLDVSKIPLQSPNDPPTHIPLQSNLELTDSLTAERIKNAFLRNERKWEYLPQFSSPELLKQQLIEVLPEKKCEELLSPKITHISAQFRTFVVYSVANPSSNQQNSSANSFVFFGNKDTGPGNKPEILPGLQDRGVIQVALGDHHFVALLSNGQVLSWGNYSQGALGLGHPFKPHRRLVPTNHRNVSPESREQRDYSKGTRIPTAVQSFSGTEHCLAVRRREIRSPNKRNFEAPPRYVFALAAAGWHTGCLAFNLDDDDDLDYGPGVLEEPEMTLNQNKDDSDEDDNSMPRFSGMDAHFRMGFAGRFTRGRT